MACEAAYVKISSYLKKRKNKIRRGGARQHTTAKYTKTMAKHVGRDKVKRVVYVKDGKKYVKKKSAKTGKFTYMPIKG